MIRKKINGRTELGIWNLLPIGQLQSILWGIILDLIESI